jgi:hypothetical protein
MVAGLEEVTEGRILIGDRDVTELPPRKRNVSMIFQNYAVWPHMTVYDNIAYALKLKRMPKREMERFAFWLGAEHPVYQVFDKWLPHTFGPYAWYVRVPDLPGFLRHVAPVLEQRLEGSLMAGHSGELKISFYRNGLRLVFDGGRLAEVEPWQPTPEGEGDYGDAGFADLTFLQLLFGYRSMEELDYAFADCWASGDKGRPLIDALFPKCHSNIWPVS